MTAQQEGGSTPAGMVAYGPEHPDYPNEPKDWDGGDVHTFDDSDHVLDRYCTQDVGDHPQCWQRGNAFVDVVAYTPRTPASGAPDRHLGWTEAGYAWLNAGAPLSTPAGEGSGVGGREAVKLLKQWQAAVSRHHDLLKTHDVTGPEVKRSGSRCAALYSRLSDVAIQALSTTAAAVQAEREACARVADAYSTEFHGKAERADDPQTAQLLDGHGFAGSNLAAAILARSYASEGGGK